jgi:hypothetical protein
MDLFQNFHTNVVLVLRSKADFDKYVISVYITLEHV